MSLRRGYRSHESVGFDFEDEYGQDPVLSRYGNTSAARQLSKARIAQSASEVELARASLNAVTEPVKQMADFFQNMNSAVKQQQDLYRTGRVNAQAAMLLPELEKAQSYTDINMLAANPQFTEALQQPENLARLNAKLEGARFRDVAVLKTRLPKVMNQQEVDDLFNEYSHLAGDDEVVKLFNTYTPVAQRRETAMKGLMEAGARQMPQTPTGEFDVDRAERALAGTYTSQDVRSLQGTASNLTKQLANYDDPEDPEAQKIQVQIDAVNRQLGNAAMQQERSALRAQAEGQSLGIGVSDTWADDIIDGGGGRPKPGPVAEPPAPVTAPTPAPAPAPVAQDPISRAEAQATAAEAEKQRLEAEATAKRRSEIKSMEDQEEAAMGELERAYSVIRRPGLDKNTFSEVAARIKQLRIQAGEDEDVIDNELRELTPARFRS